jgi:hypothetical protein
VLDGRPRCEKRRHIRDSSIKRGKEIERGSGGRDAGGSAHKDKRGRRHMRRQASGGAHEGEGDIVCGLATCSSRLERAVL